jgi:molybdate transport system substrate-binding protein
MVAAVSAWRREIIRYPIDRGHRPIGRKYTRAYNAAMRTTEIRWLARAALLAAWLLCAGLAASMSRAATPAALDAPAAPVTVLAAASLTDVLTATGEAFTRRTGIVVRHSFASSAQLARQLEAGARADMLVTADQEWMDHADRARLLRPKTRRVLAGNRLVIVAPATSPARLQPGSSASWRAALAGGRLVTGDPDSVPLGRYARVALRYLGVWESLAPRLARSENARAALALVARGEAALGVVYATDARNEPRVRTIATLDEDSHPRIGYPAALTAEAGAAATRYLDFLAGDAAQEIFRREGFTPPAPRGGY